MKYKGFLFELGKPTANGTVYSKEEMERAIEEFKKEGKHFGKIGQDYWGDFDHPTPMKDWSHEIVSIDIEKDKYGNENVFGTIDTLGTPNGKIAEEMMKQSAFALRGIGCTGELGKVKGLKIISIDLVPRNSGLGDQHPKIVEDEKRILWNKIRKTLSCIFKKKSKRDESL